MNTQPCICPQCQSIDQVQKVSSIYRAGTTITPHHITTLAGSTAMPMARYRVGHTYLSSMLRPPMPTRKLFWWKAMLPMMIPFIALEVIMMVGFNSNFRIGGIDVRILSLPTIVVAAIVCFLLFRKIRARWQNDLTRDIQPKVQIWNRLFYCYRCDLVFNPDTHQSVPPTRIEELYLSTSANTEYSTDFNRTS